MKYGIYLVNGFNPDGSPRVEAINNGIHNTEADANIHRRSIIDNGGPADKLAVIEICLN